MNAKLLSLLFILFLGIGFSSCSNNNDERGYDAGKSQGEKFREAVNKVSSGNLLAATDLYSAYQQYRENSSDPDWDKGFLEGATDFDESKYSGLKSILNQDLSLEGLLAIVPNLVEILG